MIGFIVYAFKDGQLLVGGVLRCTLFLCMSSIYIHMEPIFSLLFF